MSAATVAAGLLTCAAAAMAAAAFTSGGGEQSGVPARAPAQTTAPASDGRAVWIANGCGSCHTFAAAGAHADIGPDLAATLKGMPRSYIRESIVEPGKIAAVGFQTGAMPEDYGTRIPPAQLEQLVEFIRSGVRG